ncbi:radical SAM family heme chaperone HemW [Blautia difficilis]|uniref:Heme chaperone HemW n=1 Tax=Blautia difficilis TaxID=2763027 RepID=A0ABR7IEY3_9FIRM|nr:radical SAM family heme chaperone HemW [Blautia difficilis]MBC5778568.1 oxygen-independent coproporphyrinogen III oxidase [Blautia difficilis]
MKNRKENSPMEIYIHIPFCIRKCDYCDFLSGPSGPKEQADYVQALLREIQAAEEGEGRSVSSIFIGGGTPSVLDERLLGDILREIRNRFKMKEDAEITIEVNPGTANIGKLQAYREMGINRLSIGLQSPEDRELKILGRIHNYGQFLETYQEARTVGFDNINIDLMSAIPDQTYEGWVKNLRTVAELEPEHISAYSLIVEEGTPFAARKLNLPDEDTEYNMYEATAQILKEYGFEQYEISNYARKGRECRHNVGYWTRQDYLGFGLGASSLYGKERFANTADMKKYLENSRNPEKIREKEPSLTREDEMAEFMFLGLRMTKGISKADFQRCFGCTIESVYGEVLEKYESMELLLEKDGRIFLSREGIHVSNSIMAEFLL